jgi:hypothetical protein
MFSNATLGGLEAALIGLAVLAFFIVRQFTTRPVASRWTILAPLVLAYVGLTGLGQLDGTGWLLLALNVSLAAVLGFARGTTFRVWTDAAGRAVMRGTGPTLVLWLATFAVKIGLSAFERQIGLGSLASSNAGIWLPAAVTLATQTLIAYLRSQDQRLATV